MLGISLRDRVRNEIRSPDAEIAEGIGLKWHEQGTLRGEKTAVGVEWCLSGSRVQEVVGVARGPTIW